MIGADAVVVSNVTAAAVIGAHVVRVMSILVCTRRAAARARD
jgi:hypothetical protein